MSRSALDELMDLLESVGATVTFYGQPVSRDELKGRVLVHAVERVTGAKHDCTCVGSCRGAAGLGEGWRCVLERP